MNQNIDLIHCLVVHLFIFSFLSLSSFCCYCRGGGSGGDGVSSSTVGWLVKWMFDRFLLIVVLVLSSTSFTRDRNINEQQ